RIQRVQVIVPPEETGDARGQVAAAGTRGPECGELALQTRDVQLVEAFRRGHVAQDMQAKIPRDDAFRERWLREETGWFRQDHLTAMPGRGDPGRAVDLEAAVVIAREMRRATVEADPHADRSVLRP